MSSEIRASAKVLVNRSIGEVWDFVANVETMDHWVKGIEETERPAGDLEVGSTFTSKFIHGARTFDVTHRVTEHDPPSRFGTESTEGPFQYSSVLRLEESDGATRVTNTLRAGSGGASGLLAPVLRWGMRRQLSKELKDLKRAIERGG